VSESLAVAALVLTAVAVGALAAFVLYRLLRARS